MPLNIGVIGAGIGGLMAGAYLAKAGHHITVYERAVTVGGSAGWYIREGRRFPTGATLAFGLEKGGLLRKRLDELGINVTAHVLDHPMDIILPDRTVSVFRDPLLWERELTQKFPERAHDVLRFWRQLDQLGQAVLEITKCGLSLPLQRLYDLGTMPQWVIRHPIQALRTARYANWTVEQLLTYYKLDNYDPLCRLLNLQLVDALGTNIATAALLPSSLALTVYRYGSFALEKGLGSISEALADRIIAFDGKILTASPVRSALYEPSENAWLVDSKHGSTYFDVLIDNTGDVLQLQQANLDREAQTKASTEAYKEISLWGAFRVDTIIEASAFRTQFKNASFPVALQIAPSEELAARIGDKHGPLYVTFQQSLDAQGQVVPDEVQMSASIHTLPHQWTRLDRESYKLTKQETAAALMAEIERIVSIQQYIKQEVVGTPRTYARYMGKSNVGGIPLTVEHAVRHPISVRTSQSGLYRTGEHVFPGPGTLSSALSGWHVARAVMKEHGR